MQRDYSPFPPLQVPLLHIKTCSTTPAGIPPILCAIWERKLDKRIESKWTWDHLLVSVCEHCVSSLWGRRGFLRCLRHHHHPVPSCRMTLDSTKQSARSSLWHYDWFKDGLGILPDANLVKFRTSFLRLLEKRIHFFFFNPVVDGYKAGAAAAILWQ